MRCEWNPINDRPAHTGDPDRCDEATLVVSRNDQHYFVCEDCKELMFSGQNDVSIPSNPYGSMELKRAMILAIHAAFAE